MPSKPDLSVKDSQERKNKNRVSGYAEPDYRCCR